MAFDKQAESHTDRNGSGKVHFGESIIYRVGLQYLPAPIVDVRRSGDVSSTRSIADCIFGSSVKNVRNTIGNRYKHNRTNFREMPTNRENFANSGLPLGLST